MKSMSSTSSRPATRRFGTGDTLRTTGLGLLFASLLTVATHAATSTDKAESFVRSEAASATTLLGNKALSAGDRVRKFETLIAGSFDVRGIAGYVCGSAWEGATDAQKKRFQAVFQGALARIYSDRLRDYSGETVEVTDARPSDAGVVVTTVVTGGSSRDTRNLDWNVVSVGKGMKLVDVVIDGVSTADMTRDDYAAVLDENNNDLDALTKRLSGAPR